ncbi:hypothetical protein QUA00_32225 [Microcoleus sp. T2B6]|uniref:hypothetical protein n=1 Tax=unclassified Microcoleus TaxID=2642155 RepID=UPI002FCFF320
MRAQQFLENLNKFYNPGRAARLAENNQYIRGGWEVWLQVEIAQAYAINYPGQTCEREAPYPGLQANQWIAFNKTLSTASAVQNRNQAARSDFFLYRQGMLAAADETHIELKCINNSNPNINALTDAWNRFYADITKIREIKRINETINAIALLATYGTFSPPLPVIPYGGNAYVWDPGNNQVTVLKEVQQNGDQRFFLVAASP